MRCPSCNSENPETTRFCGSCGRPLTKRCGNCGAHRFPAARTCPHCRSEQSAWAAVVPTGVVETWCVFHRAYFDGLPVPYTVIQVRLDCGVRLFSNPVEVEPAALHIGMAVEAAFDDITPEVTLLKFKPRKDLA